MERIRFTTMIMLFSLCVNNLRSQSYIYKHYTIDNGLPGNMVYCQSQDEDGYMFFGTENGVSRFDGKTFVNFTTEDGLTDNEVLEIFSDSKGRTWFVCFAAPLCYYYKGKIFNPSNTKTLQSSMKTSGVRNIYEDQVGNIIFVSDIGIYNYDVKNKFNRIKRAFKVELPIPKFAIVTPKGLSPRGNFMFRIEENKICYLNEILASNQFHKIKLQNIHSKPQPRSICVYSEIDSIYYLGQGNEIFQFKFSKDSIFLINKIKCKFPVLNLFFSESQHKLYSGFVNDGFQVFSSKLQLLYRQLPGKSVGNILQDKYGNFWFCSLGDGIYFQNSSFVSMLRANEKNIELDVTAFDIFKNDLLAIGTQDGNIFSINEKGQIKNRSVSAHFKIKSKIRRLKLSKDNVSILVAGEKDLLVLNNHKSKTYENFSSIKDFEEIGNKEYLVATKDGCYIQSNNKRVTLLKNSRFTATCKGKSLQHWAASIDTLYKVIGQKLIADKNYNMAGSGRIIALKHTDENILWIATYNNGLKAIKGNKTYAFNASDGMLSNQCRSLFYEGPGKLWVVTSKGINKINYDTTLSKIKVKSITMADGLPSDLINQIVKKGDTIWVATNKGMAYFNEKQIKAATDIPTYLTEFSINDTITNKYLLEYNQNKVNIGFTAISFNSGEYLTFKYKLEGLDNDWNETKLRRIEYAALKPGMYIFKVKAIDKDGLESKNPALISFEIKSAWWERWWAKLIGLIAVSSLLVVVFNTRIRNVRSMEVEKTEINKKFAELRLEAIRSQMNPHFIFNCLNAIQHFNIREDYTSAQFFISEFAKLIRKTLHNSHRDFISLSDEIEVLELYIKLEKLRFEELINYEIQLDEKIKNQLHNIYVPSAIFQPFVENAINHGLKYLKEGNGYLIISFKYLNNNLVINIDDNGIGIIQSKKVKESETLKRESYGMSLNTSKIEVINKIYDLHIKCLITDKSNLQPPERGTLVEIILPLKNKI